MTEVTTGAAVRLVMIVAAVSIWNGTCVQNQGAVSCPPTLAGEHPPLPGRAVPAHMLSQVREANQSDWGWNAPPPGLGNHSNFRLFEGGLLGTSGVIVGTSGDDSTGTLGVLRVFVLPGGATHGQWLLPPGFGLIADVDVAPQTESVPETLFVAVASGPQWAGREAHLLYFVVSSGVSHHAVRVTGYQPLPHAWSLWDEDGDDLPEMLIGAARTLRSGDDAALVVVYSSSGAATVLEDTTVTALVRRHSVLVILDEDREGGRIVAATTDEDGCARQRDDGLPSARRACEVLRAVSLRTGDRYWGTPHADLGGGRCEALGAIPDTDGDGVRDVVAVFTCRPADCEGVSHRLWLLSGATGRPLSSDAGWGEDIGTRVARLDAAVDGTGGADGAWRLAVLADPTAAHDEAGPPVGNLCVYDMPELRPAWCRTIMIAALRNTPIGLDFLEDLDADGVREVVYTCSARLPDETLVAGLCVASGATGVTSHVWVGP